MELQDILIIIGVIILITTGLNYYAKSKDGRWKDSAVDNDRVKNALDKFEVEKKGKPFTERQLQSQLTKYLKGIFENVTPEYGLEGKNAIKIDFDIGNGKVGVELKLAKSVFKTSEWNRIIGQMRRYTKKYNDGNIFIVVAGSPEEKKDSVWNELQEDIKEHNCKPYFMVV